ncbi:bifunctional folylpolyglutamate synthase/dihydrofolate synthase [Nonlabens ponticola]|uniref:Dihydrofolate synthase/folylpolyglutamate synthase n=1 Tax=Nonlabens ponticola TaxID=2496866 RepID=A0A3S9MUA5_9FLAO|nr:folylpolyglutamate synthase/dihydrofolate synthase family protein [Nonlabens ponticola]AZQ42755.1 bifunctional folylpolyglutamate synthase/dihydrofolate synthase [Nonlabens ponticola]
MYQNMGKNAYRKDLGNIIKLDNHLGNPHQNFKSIHVAGTNGKGTTCHLLASVLQEAGYRVGLYTSPHIKDYRERIRINGEMIPKLDVLDFMNENVTFFEKENLSFFEMTVGLAFHYFANQKVEIAIIEVGLGGRLDSTNVITPILSVITSIDLDHTDILGDTLEGIAIEKAGIIKPRIPIIVGEQRLSLQAIFEEIAIENDSSIRFTKNISDESYFQWNVNTVEKALETLRNEGYDISDDDLQNGVDQVFFNTGLKGRYQIINENPKIILDVSHNQAGLKKLFQQIIKESFDKLHIVFGSVKNRELTDILTLLPKDANYYLCEASTERAMPLKELHHYFESDKKPVLALGSVSHCFEMASNNSDMNDLIVITGSTFILAEIN